MSVDKTPSYALSEHEKEYIKQNCLKLSDAKMASHLKRDVRTIKAYRRKLGVEKGARGRVATDTEGQPKIISAKMSESEREKFFQASLMNSMYYETLKKQFLPEEISFYLEEYGALCTQFEDIIGTERRQIDEYIKLQILGSRILRNVKANEEMIASLQLQIKALRSSKDLETDDEARERDQLYAMMNRVMSSLSQQMSSDYQKNIEAKNRLLQELKATRRDRWDQLKKTKTTFQGLVEAFREQKVREIQGRHMELVRLAADKKEDEWRRPRPFPDGQSDSVLLDEIGVNEYAQKNGYEEGSGSVSDDEGGDLTAGGGEANGDLSDLSPRASTEDGPSVPQERDRESSAD